MNTRVDYNDDRPAGAVHFDGRKIYLVPATFDQSAREVTDSLFNGYGVTPDRLFAAQVGELPAKLAESFPKDNPEAFVYRFDPKPLTASEPGEMGTLNPRKAKDNFAKLNGKRVSLRELAMTFAISRELAPNMKLRK